MKLRAAFQLDLPSPTLVRFNAGELPQIDFGTHDGLNVTAQTIVQTRDVVDDSGQILQADYLVTLLFVVEGEATDLDCETHVRFEEP